MINWTFERAAIAAAAALHHLDPDFIEAIRHAENGAPGKEFGVLSESAPTYDDQLRICCNSVAHRLGEYEGNPLAYVHNKVRYRREFARWFASKWAPSSAENDPDGLNDNWLNNAWAAYRTRINTDMSKG